ncbi:MAG: amidohydrolase [Novosphingobium sp. 28-62-57]|uniref:M20 metallopeptidase family protein n=1 Tax=unclassified Novosphingobium TaxID=2644732 RepID=UPI000BCDEA91|nr:MULTISPECIES: M20 family metallopeptidase [unclassified Novosphingobium]OYW50049.1 MAG: amidohydrolase [Novosphingobium sp. 12-62-10]OYZ12203.1 MAG: amidohydrolase [Novosphingobium sp. 28-62-57]OZA40373.1 MAG: amidohydrolase [Novosphingobium sp. 17-62-9]HQS68950.1 M20 family metallopeptidase [Novosphingobium sp.]
MLHHELLEQARGHADAIIALRRAIHAEPELGLHTPKTRDKVRAALAHLPLEWREGPSTTGLVATLKGRAGTGRRVLLRGDMDALPMTEQTGLDFSSTIPGAMHACGHDTHTAMLAGAAEVLCARADSLAGEVQFMFQPGEEGFHGARFMLDDGLIDPLPDAAFALHIMPNSPHGLVAGRTGALLASADQFDIVVEGRGGHASMPHDALDPVPVACEIVTALQSLVTRKFPVSDPVVATVAKIEAGTAHNVIADRVAMRGTLRTLSPANRARLREVLEQAATHIAQAHGMTATVTITPGFPVTVCDARAVDLGEQVVRAISGEHGFHRLDAPIMGAEDFSYVLEKVPGAMFFLGVAHEGVDWRSCCSIHSTRMMVDESVLPLGTAVLAGCAEQFLAKGFA